MSSVAPHIPQPRLPRLPALRLGRTPVRLLRDAAFVVVAIGAAAGIALGAQVAGGRAPAAKLGGPAIQPSGHEVSHVAYLAGADAAAVGEVTFRIDPPAARGVQAQFELGGPWYSCGNDNGAVTCDTTSPPLRTERVSDLTVRVYD